MSWNNENNGTVTNFKYIIIWYFVLHVVTHCNALSDEVFAIRKRTAMTCYKILMMKCQLHMTCYCHDKPVIIVS